MKKLLIILTSLMINAIAIAAGSDSSSSGSGGDSSSKETLYEDAVKLVKRAGKLEKKDKPDKAKKLYSRAFDKLEKAYKSSLPNQLRWTYVGVENVETT